MSLRVKFHVEGQLNAARSRQDLSLSGVETFCSNSVWLYAAARGTGTHGINSPRKTGFRPNLNVTNNAIIRRGNFGREFMSPTTIFSLVAVQLRFSNIFRLSPAAFPNLSKPRTCSGRVFSPRLLRDLGRLGRLWFRIPSLKNRLQIADRQTMSINGIAHGRV